MTAQLTWQKSSYSSTGDNCVEIARDSAGVAIRESDDPGVVLSADRARLAALIGGSKAGLFDRLI